MAAPVDSSMAVTILTSIEEDGVQIYGKNLHPYEPYHLEMGFSQKKHVRPSVPMPYRTVLKAGEKAFLFDVEQLSKRRAGSYSMWSKYGPGDPKAVPDADFAYVLPFRHGEKHLVGQGYLGRFTHKGSYSLDFNMDEGTPVCAARGGLVVELKQDSNRGGPGDEFQHDSNFVRIFHQDGTWASYSHLLQNGVRVIAGEKVRAGQIIGLSGNTGQSRGPHLHFAVHKARWDDRKNAIPTKFLSQDGNLKDLREGEYYYAFHPNGSRFTEIFGKNIVEAKLERHLALVSPNQKLELRTEQIDNKIMFFFQNGLDEDQKVTLDFTVLKNSKSTKKYPYQKLVPARREVYFLTLVLNVQKDTSYQAEYSYRPAR